MSDGGHTPHKSEKHAEQIGSDELPYLFCTKPTRRKLIYKKSVLIFAFIVLGTLIVGDSIAPPRMPISNVTHQYPYKGVELVKMNIQINSSRQFTLLALYTDLNEIDPQIIYNSKGLSLNELAPEAFFVVNAGFFTPEFKPTGLLANRGKIFCPFVPEAGSAGSGILLLQESKLKLLSRDETPADYDFGSADFAIQAGPRLIEVDGSQGIKSNDERFANRTVIGTDKFGRLAIVIAYANDDGIGDGPSLYELQHFLTHQGIGLVEPELILTSALNLDGGPSTGFILHIGDSIRRKNSRVKVPSAIALYRRN